MNSRNNPEIEFLPEDLISLTMSIIDKLDDLTLSALYYMVDKEVYKRRYKDQDKYDLGDI